MLQYILGASGDQREFKGHLKDLYEIFRCFSETDVVFTIDKCEFGISEISFLVWTVFKKGLSPLK